MSSGNGVLRMGEKNVENKEQRERYHALSALVLVTSPGLKGQPIPQDMIQFVLTLDCFSFLGRSNVLNATDPEPSGFSITDYDLPCALHISQGPTDILSFDCHLTAD
ncbi:hypothetical protein C8J56DRAFT_896391 [Mycena floridula]|nr:hypothetical protein C8J56DRAFT_896391 [Mycena floridula]